MGFLDHNTFVGSDIITTKYHSGDRCRLNVSFHATLFWNLVFAVYTVPFRDQFPIQ